MGKAVGRSLAAGHWPGRGPRDEAWVQITSNLVQARRLLQQRLVEEDGARVGESSVRNLVARLKVEIGADRRQVMVPQPGRQCRAGLHHP